MRHERNLLGVLLAVELGSVDHIGQGGLCFVPLTSLQTAIRVNPELIWAEVLQHFLDPVFDFLLTWDSWRVDVVDTGTNMPGICRVDENLE